MKKILEMVIITEKYYKWLDKPCCLNFSGSNLLRFLNCLFRWRLELESRIMHLRLFMGSCLTLKHDLL